MDLLPLITENLTNHEVAPSLRTNLQTELNEDIYSRDIAQNYLQNVHIEEDEYLKKNAKSVIDIYKKADEDIHKTQLASIDIMVQQAMYSIEKEKINSTLKEVVKLKPCHLFKTLEIEYVLKYNLIQSSDLLPDLVRRYLDYRSRSEVLCTACASEIKTKTIKHKVNKKIKAVLQEQTLVTKYTNSLKVIPSEVFFHNYEIGRMYQKIVKIINTSPTLQAIGLESFPKSSCLHVIFNNNNQRLAAGMCVTATVTFKPQIYRIIKDNIRFKNGLGEFVEIPICATRDVPKLISCVFKSNTNLMEHSEPCGKFEERRREALNSTIDCGSCLVSQYVLISIILENRGMTSKFFFITEDDWFFKDIDDVSSSLELFKREFWIYPTYFEIKKGEIIEINIIFQPTKPGLHVETLYLMCDNNTFQQIELVGDAIEFSKSLIEIKLFPANTEISSKDGYTLFLGHVYNKTTQTFTISVRNKSPLTLSCEWKFRKNKLNNMQDIQENWITQKRFSANITSYSTTEFDFDIYLDAQTSGYHNIFFCFYILNVPLISLKENEDFVLIERDNICGKTLSKAVDVLCTEVEVCMLIETEKSSLNCLCDETNNLPERKRKMAFSCSFVNFGILPFGLQVQKQLYLRNDSDEKLSWNILEVKYNIDVPPYLEIIEKAQELNDTYGVCSPRECKKLFYKIRDKSPLSHVSILVLISLDTNLNAKIEDICIITYEIINFDIRIKTEQTIFPILCPMEIVYKGKPTEIQFSVRNHSPIVGFFQFLSPIGEDIDKINVELNPPSSVIRPLEKLTIIAKLLCTEAGFFEDFYIPCFVGLGQKPITIKVLCVVEGPLLIIHLPVNSYYYKQVNWPIKDKNVFDIELWASKQHPSLEGESTRESTPTFNQHRDTETKLENILRKEFDVIYLHEDIIEIHDVSVSTPKKVSIFIENITPMPTRCKIGANNFTVKKKFDHVALRLGLKQQDDIWNDLMRGKYGIVVQPEIDQSEIEAHSNVMIDFWIYADTFGIYVEEVVIEIEEIPSYQFSLLIEVVGCPIQVPTALNNITKIPTIRFGTISVNSPDIKRSIKITNVSSIPLLVLWNTYLKYNEPDFNENEVCKFLLQLERKKNYQKIEKEVDGDEYFCGAANKCLDVEPKETYLNPHSSTYLNIIMKPQYFENNAINRKVTNALIGLIRVDPKYMKKANSYFRKIDLNTNIIQLDVAAQITMPSLKFDLLDKEELCIDIYANDILLGKRCEFKELFVLINTSAVKYETEISVEYPFYFEKREDEPARTKRIALNPYGISEITINCLLDSNELLCLSYLLYQEESDITYLHNFNNSKLLSFLDKYNIDTERKIFCLYEKITATQVNGTIQLPIKLAIYYPHISVKPSIVKFGTVLINQTYKDMITVFNNTGSTIKFEVTKSSEANCFLVSPHYGEIPASTGSEKQAVHIFIYFCANECRKYSESIRVVTNIPHYFTEVHLKGTGTINEKFLQTYKI